MTKPCQRALIRSTGAAAAALALGAGAMTWAATSASAATGTRAATGAIIPRCQPSQLRVWVSPDSAQGTAGTTYFSLDFTNVSGTECHLYAWPGVTATDVNGKQLGAPAARNPDVPARYVNIPAGGTAHSNLGYVDVQVTPACSPAAATYLKVYPPDDTSSRNAFFPVQACTDSTSYLTIGRVQPGA